MPYWQELVDAYMEENPNVVIEMEAISNEPYKDKMRVILGGDDVPDLFFTWDGDYVARLAEALQVKLMANPVAGLGIDDAVALGDALEVVVVVGVLEADLPTSILGDTPEIYWPSEEPKDLPERQALDLSTLKCGDAGKELLSMLSCPNGRRKNAIWEQYDSMVQLHTIAGPGEPAAIVEVPETERACARDGARLRAHDGGRAIQVLDRSLHGSRGGYGAFAARRVALGSRRARHDELPQLRFAGIPGEILRT